MFQSRPGAPADCSTLPDDGDSSVAVPGFSILALCCLLAETLQGFRETPPTKPAAAAPCTYPAGQCIKPSTTDQFRDFLRRPAFRNEFDDEKVAKRFVNGVRNGIFHEAETRGWVIQRDRPLGRILTQEGKRYMLNRSEFYKALKAEFDVYLQELRDPGNAATIPLREEDDPHCEGVRSSVGSPTSVGWTWTRHAAERKRSSCRSQVAIWFQLAKVWLAVWPVA